MGSHQAFPELAVVGHEKVQQFVHDHIIPNLFIHIEQFGVEIKVSLRRARSPLVLHGANAEPYYAYIELMSPLANALLESDLRVYSSHDSDTARLFQQLEQIVYNACYPIKVV